MRGRFDARFPSLFALIVALGAACHGAGGDADRPKPPPPLATASAPASSAPAPSGLPPKTSAVQKLAAMKANKACVLSASAPASKARAGAKPFESPEPHCIGDDMFCDTVDRAPPGADACYVSNEHLRRAEQKARGAAGGAAGKGEAWDGAKKPAYLDRIDAHLHLDAAEHALLRKNGFVVLDRLAYPDYANALHDVFQEELPLWVGADPILHAVFRATEGTLGKVEQKRLAPLLEKMLAKLQKGLREAKGRFDEVTRGDLDLYLTVASALAGGKTPDGAAGEVLDAIGRRQLEPIEIFGRPRMVDFSQYEPRGHYASGNYEWSPDAYFQAMTWLSRFEWNLVSRDSRSSHPEASPDPRETPREAKDALALAELFRRSGALPDLAAFEEVYSAFAGRREDVSIPDLLALMDRGRISAMDEDPQGKLKAAIGDGFRRSARVHFMPQGVKDLPVITTIFGPRIAPDIAPLERLVHDKLPGRTSLGAADVGYLLGHDRAARYLEGDLQKFPALKGALDAARADLLTQTNQNKDIQASFLRAVLALALAPAPGRPAEGMVPSFMSRDAYADLRMSSALVGYAELRHTFVLLSGQGYDAYGCAIPDAYVEPLAPFYAALLDHTERLRKIAGGGFEGLTRVLRMLAAITKTELSRGAPSAAQAEWLGMVAEHVPRGGYGGDSGEPPKWTGWYFDMFEDREIGATKAADLVADYFTLTNEGEVAYLGTNGPRLGVFVVDTGGGPRALVGPVASGYELKAPLGARLDDAAARTSPDKRSSFRESFAAAPAPEPALGLAGRLFDCTSEGKLEARLVLASDRDLGPVTVTLLDHHGDPLAASLTADVAEGLAVYPFSFPEVTPAPAPARSPSRSLMARSPARSPVEALAVRVEDLAHAGLGRGPYDWMTSPSVFWSKDFSSEGLKARPRGAGPFLIGGTWDAPQAETPDIPDY